MPTSARSRASSRPSAGSGRPSNVIVAGVDRLQPVDRPAQRRLARPGRADHHDDLAAADRQCRCPCSTCSGPKCLFTPCMHDQRLGPSVVRHGPHHTRPEPYGQRSGKAGGPHSWPDRDLGARHGCPGDTLCAVMSERERPRRERGTTAGPSGAAVLSGRESGTAHARTLRGPHVRLPDERARLRAAVRPAGGRRLRPRRRDGGRADVVVFNTCAVRENADNRLYGNLGHLRAGQGRAIPACRSRSAAAWPRRTAARSCAARPGSTSSSARTTSARCRCCSSGPGINDEAQVEIAGVAGGRSRRRCRPGASRRTRPGCRSRSAATTPARSASCPSLRGKEKDRRPGRHPRRGRGAGRARACSR